MLKKNLILLLIGLLLLSFTACTNSDEKPQQNQTTNVDASVEDASAKHTILFEKSIDKIKGTMPECEIYEGGASTFLSFPYKIRNFETEAIYTLSNDKKYATLTRMFFSIPDATSFPSNTEYETHINETLKEYYLLFVEDLGLGTLQLDLYQSNGDVPTSLVCKTEQEFSDTVKPFFLGTNTGISRIKINAYTIEKEIPVGIIINDGSYQAFDIEITIQHTSN